jgi:hypothetical protein
MEFSEDRTRHRQRGADTNRVIACRAHEDDRYFNMRRGIAAAVAIFTCNDNLDLE